MSGGNVKTRQQLGVSLAAIAACVAPSFAAAAVVGAASTSSDSGVSQPRLEEVVVTARKREESLLEVPVTVTALTGAALQSRNIVSLMDVTDYTPGFQITDTGGTPGAAGGSRADRSTQSLIVRGVINRTSLFIDGAPVSSGFVQGVDDLDRVEVIKGPQSAYFGRSTFIGAINLVTKTPADAFKGTFSALYGSNNWQEYRAAVEGPIVPDKLALRLSFRDYSMDGQYKNTGGPETRLGDQSTRSFTASLYANPVDNLTIKILGIAWRDSDGPAATGKFTRQDYNCNAGAAPAGKLNYICGVLPAFPVSRLGQNDPIDPLFQSVILNNTLGLVNPLPGQPSIDHGGLERRAYHGHIDVEYKVPGSLGLTLSSITAYDRNDVNVINDLDIENTYGIPNPLYGKVRYTEPYVNWLFNFQLRDIDVSQEFRITTDQSKRLRGLIGASYEYSKHEFYSVAIAPFGLSLNGTGAPLETKTGGAFFSVAYDPFQKLTLSVEGRYQTDEVKQYSRPFNKTPETLLASTTYNNFTPRVIAQYKPTSSTMLYGSYSVGINPGTFNTQILTANAFQLAALKQLGAANLVVKPEKLTNYEVGAKGRFWDDRLQLTAAVYYAIWSDQIVNQSLPVPSVDANGNPNGGETVFGVSTNIGKTILDGVEVEGVLAPARGLTINFAGSMNDSNIRNYVCVTPCSAITGNTNVTGKQLYLYSRWSATLGAEYTRPLTAVFDWFVRGDYIYKSGIYPDFTNVVKTMDTNKINLHAGVRSKQITVEAFVQNLTNNLAPESVERNVDVLSPGFSDNVLNVGMPLLRQFGVRASYTF